MNVVIAEEVKPPVKPKKESRDVETQTERSDYAKIKARA